MCAYYRTSFKEEINPTRFKEMGAISAEVNGSESVLPECYCVDRRSFFWMKSPVRSIQRQKAFW